MSVMYTRAGQNKQCRTIPIYNLDGLMEALGKVVDGLRRSSVKNQKGYDVGLEPSSAAALLNVWQTRHCLRVDENTAGLNRLGNIQLHLSPLWIVLVPDLVTPDSKHTP